MIAVTVQCIRCHAGKGPANCLCGRRPSQSHAASMLEC